MYGGFFILIGYRLLFRMMHKHIKINTIIYIIIWLKITTMPLILWQSNLNWHDQQRITQIIIILISTTLLFQNSHKTSPANKLTAGMISFFLLGAISASLSATPAWAFTEIALFLGSLGMVLVFRQLLTSDISGRWVLLAASCLCLGVGFKFSLAYLAALLEPDTGFLLDEMLDGFSNRRFFGQVATLLIPLLLSAMFFAAGSWPKRYAAALWVLAAWVWFMVIGTGTRGTWLALAVSAVIVFVIAGKPGRQLALAITTSALAGLALSHLLLTLVPAQTSMQVAGHPSERLTTSLSAREVIWGMSLDMIKENPLLGVGPMHFAAAHNPVAAHPHNALLQLAAEWGVPATLLALFLVGSALWHLIATIRRRLATHDPQNGLRIALFAALVGAGVQSMVDGVIVMPTTMVWLAIIAGWAWALQPQTPTANLAPNTTGAGPADLRISVKHWLFCLPFLISALWLTAVAIRDLPMLLQSPDTKAAEHVVLHDLKPRFWQRGFIHSP